MPAKKSTSKKTSTKKTSTKTKKDIDTIEKKVDSTMDTIATKLDGKVSKATKAKAKKIMDKADDVAEEVDELIGKVDDLADNFLPHGSGSSALFDAQWSENISRLFIFRFLWMIVQYFVLVVRGLWISVLTVIHWIYMFIFGKRERNLWNRQVRFYNHVIKWKSYMSGLTDERPDMITPAVK